MLMNIDFLGRKRGTLNRIVIVINELPRIILHPLLTGIDTSFSYELTRSVQTW